MLKKISLIILFISAVYSNALARTSWEGTWEYGRYTHAYGGSLNISDCKLNVCNFSIKTFHGAHTCDVAGKLKIDGNKGLFYRYLEDRDNVDEQKIVMKLNPEKQTINIDWQSGRFCGVKGDISGLYENKLTPLRYPTSFDCRANNLQVAEKTVCSSEVLAQADKEFFNNYPEKITYLWKKERNTCGNDEKCLWNFYTNNIFSEYKNKYDGNFSLYQYIKDQNQKWYYPTDFTLLRDYLQNNMSPEDYSAWQITLYDEIDTEICEDCSFMKYGITGLYTQYESAFFINNDEIWLAFVSANLPESKKNHIIVYAPQNKKESDMPANLKKWIQYLAKHYPDEILIKNFERPKKRIIKRNWYNKAVGEILQDTPEIYTTTINNQYNTN